jgi:trimethylamine:corrinoid methyltransferase-like protein
MRSGLAAFGAPEYLVALLSRRRVREFYHLPCAYSETMMTDAKCPDQQAAAEKAVLSACAAMAGFRAFESAGSLFIDEIFSPQQLLVDIEIKDYIQHALSGARRERSIDEIQELVSEGLDGNGFLGAPNTVDNWRSFYWRPSLYLQTSRSNWQLAPRKVLDAAWESARAKISAHTYELGGEKLRGLEEILAEACEAFGGKSALPTVLGPL